MPGLAKCISALPHRRSPIRIITASTPRRRTSSLPPPTIWRVCGSSSARIRSPSSRSTASTAPWARRGATRRARNSPTIASLGNIRLRSPTAWHRKHHRASSPCWLQRAERFSATPGDPPMVEGLSHITFTGKDLERMKLLLVGALGGEEIYDSGDKPFSISREKFFEVGGIWIAVMEGDPLSERTYNHVAFKISADDLPRHRAAIEKLGLPIREPRP